MSPFCFTVQDILTQPGKSIEAVAKSNKMLDVSETSLIYKKKD